MYKHQDKMSKPCHRYESTLIDTTITVDGSKFDMFGYGEGNGPVPIQVKITAYKLDYGPVIDLTITVSVPYTSPMDWSDHPFMLTKRDRDDKKTPKSSVGEIIDDTPAVRAILTELAQPEKFKLYTTTDCTHRAALIASLEFFWS